MNVDFLEAVIMSVVVLTFNVDESKSQDVAKKLQMYLEGKLIIVLCLDKYILYKLSFSCVFFLNVDNVIVYE